MCEVEGGDADDAVHAAELESVLLPASSADNETDANPAMIEPPFGSRYRS
jgi:hypothetical protein